MVYLAIEHNAKYLASLAEQAHSERVIAVRNETKTLKDNEEFKTLNTEMNKELKVYKKDSQALGAARI
jgi:hypothetical protein